MRAILLLGFLLAGPAAAQAPPAGVATGVAAGGPRHAGNAPSSYAVRPAPPGQGTALSWRNLRYELIRADRGGRQVPHLVTIVTTAETVTESEGHTGRVSVTVDDLSGTRPRRVAAFSEAGNSVVVLRDDLLVITTPGCCAAGTVRSVRRLPDGRPLFRSTGPGETGIAAFVRVGDGSAPRRRWAAYDGMPEGAEPGVIGILAYGGEDGPLARFALRLAGDEGEVTGAEYGLRDRGMLFVVSEGRSAIAPYERPASVGVAGFDGTAVTAPGPETFAIRLTDGEGKAIADIPVEEDRPVPARGTFAPGYTLTPMPGPVPGPVPARAPSRPAR